MARSTLARHRFGASGRYTRTSAEGGGGGTGGGGSNNGAGSGTDGGGSGGGGSGGTGGQNGTGGGAPQSGPHGFPENTAIVEMTLEQQAAYHKYQGRKWQERAEARGDYDEQKRLADLYRQQQLQNLPPDQRAIEEAKEQGRREASAAAATDTVGAVLRVALEARGKTGDELNLIVTGANPAAFLTDGRVDAVKVSAYVATIAGSPGGGGADGGGGAGQNGGQQSGGGSIGQGQREQAPSKGVGAGKSLFAERHPKAAAAANANA